MHLFTEVFPIEPALTEYVGAYLLASDLPTPDLERIGRVLARRLRDSYPAEWVWAGGRLLTDGARSDIELMIALDILRGAEPDRFGTVTAITSDPQPDASQIAEFILRAKADAHRPALTAALRKFNATLHAADTTVRIERDVRLAAWAVDGAPALSITVSSRLVYGRDAAAALSLLASLDGLRISHPESHFSAEVIGAGGSLKDERPKLLRQKLPDTLLRLIQTAPDESPLLRLKNQYGTLRLPAAGLQLLLRPVDLQRVGVDPEHAEPDVRPDPPTRAAIVRTLSETLKDAGVIGRAYSSREQPARFFIPAADDLPYLRFAGGRTRPAVPGRLAADFMATGAFGLRDRFKSAPIRVCIVNALQTKIEDFVEALQRQLARKMNFSVEILRERQVRVVSEANLDAAVKTVEKEHPDLILFFLPDPQDSAGIEPLADYVKNLSLGRGLPSHIVHASVIDDPDAMPGLIVQILARTGNTPAALADPLEGFNAVVGLDLVRRTLGDAQQIVAIARAYSNNGAFLNYAVRTVDVSGDQPPYLLMRGLFSQKAYAGKKVVLHVNGRLPDDVKKALVVWGQAIRAQFAIIEIVRRGAPRLYAFDEGKVIAPPVGSAFCLDDHQALLVLTSSDEDGAHPQNQGSMTVQSRAADKRVVYLGQTPQPVHILADGLPIRQALDSVRRWALLDYSPLPRGIPATILNTDALAFWLNKGGTFAKDEGDVPFWL